MGDGPACPDLYRVAKEHNLLQAVIFTGPVNRQEIAAHIAAMDITVQPAATEYACPMKLIEYMAMQKCIIAPDQPNVREILSHRDNAYLFRPGDHQHLAEMLLDLLAHDAQRNYVARNAYQTIFDREYFWSSNARRTLDLVFSRPEVPRYTSEHDPSPSAHPRIREGANAQS